MSTFKSFHLIGMWLAFEKKSCLAGIDSYPGHSKVSACSWLQDEIWPGTRLKLVYKEIRSSFFGYLGKWKRKMLLVCVQLGKIQSLCSYSC